MSARHRPAALPGVGRSRLWRHSSAELLPGRHGLPPAVVVQIQRERLLRAMVAVVAEQGYQASSVAKILDRAGVSRRTFYDLFDNREACFLAAYEEVAARALTLVEQAYNQGSSAGDRIERALQAFLDFWAEHPEEACACIDELLTAGAAARACHTRTVERLASLLERALGELRGLSEPDPLAARAFVGGIYELIQAHVDHDDLPPLPALAERIVAWERRLPGAAPTAAYRHCVQRPDASFSEEP